MSKIKKLSRNFLIFAIGNIGSKGINFILLPYYTALLSASEYGEIDLSTSLLGLFVPIISLNMADAVFRYCLDKKYSKKKILSTSIIIAIITFLGSLIFYPIIDKYKIFGNYTGIIYILLFFMIIQGVLKQFVRAIGKINIFIYSDFLQVITFVIFNIIFIGYLNWAVIGYFIAKILSVIIDTLVCIIGGKVYKYISFNEISKKNGSEMIEYALPLVPNSMMWWVMNLSDRMIINSIIGLSANGLYAVACKFPTIISLISGIFFNAWQISAVEEVDSEKKGEFYSKVLNQVSFLLILCIAILLCILKPIMKILIGDVFFEAWEYVPFLLIGSIFSVFSSFLGTEYITSKDTKGAINTSMIAASINLGLNLLLIPRHGIQGATFSTMISFIVLFYIRNRNLNKRKEIVYDKLLIVTSSFLLVFQTMSLFQLKKINFIVNIIALFVWIIINFKYIKAICILLKFKLKNIIFK